MPKLSDDPLFNMPTAYSSAASKGDQAAPGPVAAQSPSPDKNSPRDAVYEPDYPYFASAFQDDFCYPAPWAITSVP